MAQYYPLNSFRLCVDNVVDNTYIGRAYSPMNAQAIIFKDYTSMILQIDKIFDLNDYPKAYQQKRSFTEETINHKEIAVEYSFEEIMKQKGQKLTLDVIVVSRQHSSWQGIIKNMSGEIIGSFESVLNLIDFLVNYMLCNQSVTDL